MFRQTVWTPRDSNTYADDDWSDAHPSPLHPSYNDASPSSNWLSPVAVGDDADNLFDLTQTNDFISLLDDSSSRQEQQHMLRRWMTPAAKSNPRALSRQATLDDVVIAGGWEEKIVRRWQRKHGLQGLTLREVKREMPPIEFDPAFADSDTEDEDEPAFHPDMLVDPPMRVVAPRFPSPISIPSSGPFPSDAPLSPLTPLSSEPQQDFSLPALSPSPPPALIPARAPTPHESAADPSPASERASSPIVKQEPEDASPPSRASSPLKRTFSEAIQDAENVLADDATSEEGEYVPSDDEEDDADPTYGAPKARRVSSSHGSGHARTTSNADKPARAGPGRRRRLVDDAAPSQCTYENPLTGSRCQQIFARLPEMKRHIDHFHHEQEARAVMEGKLPRERATLLGASWDGTLGKPTCEGCGTEFSRRDAVKRHQNEVKAQFEDGRCVWCPGTQGRKGSAKRVAAAKLASGSAAKRQRRK